MSESTEEDLPRVLAIGWGMDEAPRRGPKRELSHEGIVGAAIEIADAQGLAAVTMQRVAESLGYTTMSLYRYLANKNELIMLMADDVLRAPEVLAIDAEDWQVGLRDFADALGSVYRDHPWVMDVPISAGGLLMPNNMKYADAGLRAMRTLPLAADERQATLLVITMFVRTFSALRRDLQQTGPSAFHSTAALELVRSVATVERFPDLAPAIISGLYVGQPPAHEPVADDFEFGLERLIDGLAAYVANRPAPSSEPAEPTHPSDDSPAAALARAQADLTAVVAQHKAAQARVKELYQREDRAERQRNRARAATKR